MRSNGLCPAQYAEPVPIYYRYIWICHQYCTCFMFVSNKHIGSSHKRTRLHCKCTPAQLDQHNKKNTHWQLQNLYQSSSMDQLPAVFVTLIWFWFSHQSNNQSCVILFLLFSLIKCIFNLFLYSVCVTHAAAK